MKGVSYKSLKDVLDRFCFKGRVAVPRLEICQKIYTTGFSGQKFYTLKVRNATIFTQRETAYMHLYQLF